MIRSTILFPVLGYSLLLLVSQSLAAPKQYVLEAILESVKNIEDLIRGSPESSLYVPSAVGRSANAAAAAGVYPQQFAHSRDAFFNIDPFEKDELREILNWESRGARSANTNSNSNSNSNTNANRKQRLPADGLPMRPYRRSLSKLRRRPRIEDRMVSEEDEDNANGNLNSNSNVNTNSNVNSNAIDLTPVNNLYSGKKMKSARNSSGSRSLSKPRVRDLNRNVNTNVNSNSNSNSNGNGNTLDAFNDDDFDYENSFS